MGTGESIDYSLRENWDGLLADRERSYPETRIFAVVKVAKTGSVPFLGLAVDGGRYWVKYVGNAHGMESLVSERVVEALARKLNAPMRPSILVDVPDAIMHDPRLLGSGIQAGVAHGSLFLDGCLERSVLDSVGRDGNASRQPRFIALWELCYGEDGQWLYDRANEEQVWSYDHGYWITGGEPNSLTIGALEITLKSWKQWDGPIKGMNPDAFLEVADRLDALTAQDFIDVVASVPLAWGVTDAVLEALAWWLHHRKTYIAKRMRAMATAAAKVSKPRSTPKGAQ